MLLWTAFALMTGAAVLAVLWPLRAGAATQPVSGDAANLAVYRDQLAEIGRDRDAGRIAGVEAEAARLEVARRLLTVADRAPAAAGSARTARRRAVAVLALIGVPLLAGGLYLTLGSPGLEGQPLAARLEAAPQQAELAVLLRRVEARLESHPEDGRGHEVVAPIYLRLGRAEDAAGAWRAAIASLGPSAERESGLGEALTAASGGVVTADAKAAFARAVALDAGAVKARYYLGLAAEQDGRRDEASTIWTALAVGAPADAAWLPTVRAAIGRVAPGPDAAAVAAAQDMTPEQRADMVRGMVERLSARLGEGGGTVDDWLRLVRAWTVLGDEAKARVAASEARQRFAGDAGALGRIDALARELGLEG
ncbi:MAG TPA: c-type cytochrome biogenesis protein CcmI [Xanthobacteraceae bacterium]|nr:c-type cytochrome biogenesis protein CcmI [Xanthobacteraceae bacterium]